MKLVKSYFLFDSGFQKDRNHWTAGLKEGSPFSFEFGSIVLLLSKKAFFSVQWSLLNILKLTKSPRYQKTNLTSMLPLVNFMSLKFFLIHFLAKSRNSKNFSYFLKNKNSGLGKFVENFSYQLSRQIRQF